jgi:hypothetical protein
MPFFFLYLELEILKKIAEIIFSFTRKYYL